MIGRNFIITSAENFSERNAKNFIALPRNRN